MFDHLQEAELSHTYQYLRSLLVYKRHFNGFFGHAFLTGVFNQRRMVFSAEACSFNAFLISFLFNASLIIMTCTAVIRYLCVVKSSLHHQYVKPKIVAVGISFFWLINYFLQVFLLSVSNWRGRYSRKQIFCLFYIREEGPLCGAINNSGLAGGVILGLLIFLAYFKVFRFVSYHNNTVASKLQQRNTLQKEEVKITKTLVAVV